ncbi:hypothetical protein Micbo1qcDRAFT_197175 [Microdochium bolleyi]|uniref:MmgE/PrpD N-terminal domain-containing protein n=1 Tax=Microdochium bolleyi TaxID=196109 RepID=A0A136IVC2_9PEZI|nr:hypothetical protein Micbo1qcDRAFT_197175 [Microdochium bolleyi]
MTEATAASDALPLLGTAGKEKDERAAAAADSDPARGATTTTTTTTNSQDPPPKPPAQKTAFTHEQAAHRILVLGSIHFLCTLANITGVLTHRYFLTGVGSYWDNMESGLISFMSPVLASRVQVSLCGTGVFAALAMAAGENSRFLSTWAAVAFWASFGLEAWLGMGTRGRERLVDMILRAAQAPSAATLPSSSSSSSSSSPPPSQPSQGESFGNDTKPFHIGRAAQNGLMAALLAERGFTGSRWGLEADCGWVNVVSTRDNVTELFATLGDVWETTRNTFEPYPCDRVIHGAVDAVIQLRAQALEQNLDLSQVAKFIRTKPLESQDGKKLEVHVEHATGSYLNLLRTDQLKVKFTGQIGAIIGEERAGNAWAASSRIANATDVAQ